ncbi:MAG TPA: BTAD domain-containing putative transcriptional regulator [Natronosporangium sp.]
MDDLAFRILGTIEVWRAGELVPIAAARQRDVLVSLLLQANRVVAVDRLIALVWGDQPPPTALNTLHTLIRRLRRQLAGSPAEAQQILQTRPPGYRLVVAPDRLDLSQFERLRQAGREALAGGDPQRAAQLLTEAVTLWRGPALADVTAHWLRQVEQPRLQELYLQAVEERIEAELACGRHAEVLPQLRQLIAEQPMRERPYGHLMLALYRSGRQAEALVTYRQLRTVIAEELGIEPDPALQQLHQAVLRGDPALRQPAPSPEVQPAEVRRPAQLPPDVGAFTGRTDELSQLDKVLIGAAGGPIPAVAIVGTAGVGKTTLAVHWAHRLRDRFPDGQLYIDLQGYAPVPPLRPIDALGQFIRALGVPPERVPADPQEAAGLYRTLLAERRVLVVLDNARAPDQVRPLLPGSPGCLAVVTSRDRLDGLVARDGAYRLRLDVLPPDEAAVLLRRAIDEDGQADQAGIAELARLCAYLPLALQIAAAHLAGRPVDVAGHVRRLRAGGELAGLAVAGDEQTAVRGAFDFSYASLPADCQRMFRLLGVFPGTELPVAAAASMAGVAEPLADQLLEQLAAAHLVYEPAPGRYACHDLLRHYAAELAEPDPDRPASLRRLGEWYLSTVDRAARLLYPELTRLPAEPTAAPADPDWTDPADALAWLDTERANLVRFVQHTAEHGPRPLAYRLADGLRGYFHIARHVTDSEAVSRAGAAAAAAEPDRFGQAASQLGLADFHRQQHHYPAAGEHYRRAAALAEQAGWPACQAAALAQLGALYGETGQLATEVEHLTRALAIYQRIGHREGEAACLGNLGVACFELGRLPEAAEYYTRALALDRAQGSRLGQAYTLNGLGEAYLELDRLDRARDCLTEGLALFRQIGSPIGESQSLAILAEVHCRGGDYQRARRLAEQALAVLRSTGDQDAYARWGEALARNALGLVQLHTGDVPAAIAEHQRALRAVRDGGNPHPEAETLLALAVANLALARPAGPGSTPDQAARAYASQALTIARERGYRLLEERAAALLAGTAD